MEPFEFTNVDFEIVKGSGIENYPSSVGLRATESAAVEKDLQLDEETACTDLSS